MSTQTATRADRLAEAIAERGTDVLVVSNLVDVRYLTGYSGSNGLALVGPGAGGLRVFLTDFRYVTQAAAEVGPEWDRRPASQELMGQGLVDNLPGAADGERLRVAFDDVTVTVRQHARWMELFADRVELVPAGGMVARLREVKDADEVRQIRAAAEVADAAMTEVLARGLAGRTERDVALDLEIAMRRAGAEAVSFAPIVASGAHGALPHAQPREVAIEAGQLVTIDWGAKLGGYCSDCTRTFSTGEIDDEARDLYELVRRAQWEALAAVRPGPTGQEVDRVARDIIGAAGHGEEFGHGLGHGVGLEIHEPPRLSKQSETELVAGMVVTVEPGVYVPGRHGVRIEDLVVVTESAHDVLNTLPKDLQVVG